MRHLALCLLAVTSVLAATPEQIKECQRLIREAQEIFVKEAAVATGLAESQIREFMPGQPLYGKNIGSVHRLTPAQLDALRKVDDAKKAKIAAARKACGF
jgi:hypothetical protein